MCSNPITHGDNTFACRHCNECISARKSDWVARCMAEKATSSEAVVLNLTYRNNPDETLPDAARAFRYQDVQLFLKRLRKAYTEQYNAHSEIRYVVAGEQGSQNDRVHWHMIIFADRPIGRLGEWTDFVGNPIEGLRPEKMVHWNFWPHGHIKPQRPDEGGMQYVLKYALKDQFNVVNAKGTMRESKAENYGASFFRMSKKPPIGHRWLERKCDNWQERGVVPVKLQLKIPETNGFWWPKGKQREYLLKRLHHINQEVLQNTGRNARQWSALLASVVEQEKDWEILNYGEEKSDTEWEPRAEGYFQGNRSAYVADRKVRDTELAASLPCRSATPCAECYFSLAKQDRHRAAKWYASNHHKWNISNYSEVKNLPIQPYCKRNPHGPAKRDPSA